MTVWFHGGTQDFTPSWAGLLAHSFKGEGIQRYGFGLYLSQSQELAEAKYAVGIQPKVFRVELAPSTRIVPWEEPLDSIVGSYLLKAVPKPRRKTILAEISVYPETTFGEAYALLAEPPDGLPLRYSKTPDPRASELMVAGGVDGALGHEPDGTPILALYNLAKISRWEPLPLAA